MRLGGLSDPTTSGDLALGVARATVKMAMVMAVGWLVGIIARDAHAYDTYEGVATALRGGVKETPPRGRVVLTANGAYRVPLDRESSVGSRDGSLKIRGAGSPRQPKPNRAHKALAQIPALTSQLILWPRPK